MVNKEVDRTRSRAIFTLQLQCFHQTSPLEISTFPLIFQPTRYFDPNLHNRDPANFKEIPTTNPIVHNTIVPLTTTSTPLPPAASPGQAIHA